jgi:hypothetical protein
MITAEGIVAKIVSFIVGDMKRSRKSFLDRLLKLTIVESTAFEEGLAYVESSQQSPRSWLPDSPRDGLPIRDG